jgi:hypothetical protein
MLEVQLAYADPEPGFYRMRLVRRGPWVAARIWRARFGGYLHGSINGQPASPDRIWGLAEAIDEEQYARLMEDPPARPMEPLHLSRAIADRIAEAEERADYWARNL